MVNFYLPKEIHAAVPISFGLATAYNPYKYVLLS